MNTKIKSNKQEKKVAKDMKAKVTIASGALYFQKADVRNNMFLVECKTTAKAFYSLTLKTWQKICKEANSDGMRTPIMCIELLDGKTTVAVMNYLDFIGYDFDTQTTYVGNPMPDLITASSVRLTDEFINSDFPQTIYEGQTFCHRRDIKFVGANHLVVIPWEDFIDISERLNYV